MVLLELVVQLVVHKLVVVVVAVAVHSPIAAVDMQKDTQIVVVDTQLVVVDTQLVDNIAYTVRIERHTVLHIVPQILPWLWLVLPSRLEPERLKQQHPNHLSCYRGTKRPWLESLPSVQDSTRPSLQPVVAFSLLLLDE